MFVFVTGRRIGFWLIFLPQPWRKQAGPDRPFYVGGLFYFFPFRPLSCHNEINGLAGLSEPASQTEYDLFPGIQR